MALFLSKSVHKIDKKGRVSVPAAFRSALGDEVMQGVALMPSLRDLPCVEGCRMSRIEQYADRIDDLNPLGEEQAALAMTVLADMRQVSFDGEGRIILPEEFIELAGLTEQALFAGLGKVFQIWNPKTYDDHRAKAREVARRNIDLMAWGGKSRSDKPEGDKPGGQE